MTLDLIVARNARRFPHKAALVGTGGSRSWLEVDQRVNRLANALLASGLGSGDRVAVLAGNCPEYLEIYFACARAGLIAVPLNYRLTPRELAQILTHAEPSLLIAAAAYEETVAGLRALLENAPGCWRIEDDGASPDSLAARMAAADDTPVTSPAQENDTFAIFYTSGTTGLPKGAMVSHLNLEMNGYNQAIADNSRAEDINLVATPVYHMGAVFMAVTYMLLGCTQVILPRFEPRTWADWLKRHRCTVSLLIPTMINAILNDDEAAGADLSSLRLVFYGGGPMPPAVLERAIAVFGSGFTQGYGLTETLEATFLVAADHRLDDDPDVRRRLASAGREAVGADIRIVDDAGRDLATDEIGEILVRSRSVIRGYWRQPEESAKAIRDGWFYTSDMGYLDADRYLFVVDRKKDMVVSGGVNIYTKEIEAVLYQHPAVLEAAIIGLPDENWGEIVTAVIVLRDGHSLEHDEVVDWCRDRIADFKKPRRTVLMDALPKNPSGKILKRELRDALSA